MQPVHVLHISTEKNWRGGEQQIAYLIQASAKWGVRCSVAVRKGSAFERWCAEHGVDHYSMSMAGGLDVLTARGIRAICRKADVNVVHTHSGKGLTLVYIAILLGLNLPVMAHRRVDFALSKRGISAAKYNHTQVRQIVCVSDAIAHMVRRTADRPERVVTVHSGIDFARFQGAQRTGMLHRELRLPESTPIVGNVAALAPHKDYPTFIKVAAEVCREHPYVHFVAVGEGELEAELRQQVNAAGLSDRLHFMGFRTDIPQVLAELDVFLITSRTEGLGTSVIDAMYSGLPVVATQAGGIPELVLQGITGVLCPVGDAHALAQELLRLLHDAALRTALGTAARKRAALFSKDAMAEKVVSLYKDMVGVP
jgi:glycosyltransferase involved in cell wall biosynthesis